jgi:cytochrome c553
MSKKSFLMFAIVFFFTAFSVGATVTPSGSKAPAMPDNVKSIIEKSCIGCHNTDSKNDKAKEALDLKTFDTLSKQKMIHALKEIGETLEENEMPPAKFLEKYPDKKLSDADKKILMDWANSEAKSLMK